MSSHGLRGFVVVLALASAGCQNTLETGYKFRPLSGSENERRAFYAPAFTPEATGAEDEDQSPADRP